MKINVIMFYDQPYSNIGNLTADMNKKYCNHFKYTLSVHRERVNGPAKQWAPLWEKIPLLLQSLSQPYDWSVFIDADAFFINHKISLESIIQKYSDKETCLIVSDHFKHPNVINTGVMLVKHCDKSKEILNHCIQYALKENKTIQQERFHEQTSLQYLYDTKKFDFKRHINIIDESLLNCPKPERATFILHVYSESIKNSKFITIKHYMNQFLQNNGVIKSVSMSNMKYYISKEDKKITRLTFGNKRVNGTHYLMKHYDVNKKTHLYYIINIGKGIIGTTTINTLFYSTRLPERGQLKQINQNQYITYLSKHNFHITF